MINAVLGAIFAGVAAGGSYLILLAWRHWLERHWAYWEEQNHAE